MVLATTQVCFFMLFLIISLQLIFGTDTNVLNVGKELQKETIPLQNGSRFYKLQGLKPSTWYEVKISYPASIPASFYLQLKKEDDLNVVMNHRRKLLNTEKLIFKNDDADLSNELKNGTYVLLTVEPEGVVAIPNGKEREMVIYNIVCDELVLGIPHKAWWVVILAVLCLVLAFVIPSFLPSFLMSTDQTRGSTSKNS
uniref:uncharacterized protein LOC122594816 n=1 Tax=Erigeron canadensis TaxID=72917 RepID=UPI001CB90826|nr:uncharacterized protein LOC122594816 [Erigeron canadensis]